MKFNFSYGITLSFGQYEPALKFSRRSTLHVCQDLSSAFNQE